MSIIVLGRYSNLHSRIRGAVSPFVVR
jgi:hypothetical protein